MTVLLDTGLLVAFVVRKDARHAEAVSALRRVAEGEFGAASTTDYVVAEGLNFLRRKVGRREIEEAFLRLVFGSPKAPPAVAPVHRIHSGRFARGLELYRRHAERGLSFTDCTSLAVLGDRRIPRLATFDGGFRGLVEVVP